MSSMIREVAILEERVDNLEEREESTRRKFDEHLSEAATEQRAMAAALESIRLDVHEIRLGKKAMVRIGSVALAILAATGTGVVLAANWTLDHALQDWQTQHNPASHKEIP